MTSSTSIDVKRCLGFIKQLQAKNQELTRERDEALENLNQTKQELLILENRLMNYSASEQSSEAQCVPIDDGTAEEENIDLKVSLPSQIIQVDENYVKNLENLLQEKDREICKLQQTNQDLAEANIPVSKIKRLIQETKSLSLSYIAQLEKMQNCFDSSNTSYCQETTLPQEVSGDQDPSSTPSGDQKQSSLRKELDRVKAENEALMSHKQNVEATQATIVAEKSDLEEENKRLQTQISILSTAKTDFPIENQIKVFLDDFQDERKEKEQQYKEKREMYEDNQKLVAENHRLKEKLEKLARQTSELQQQMAEWSPPHVPNVRMPLAKVAYDRGGSYHEPLVRPLSSSGSEYMRTPSNEYPYLGEPSGPTVYYDNPATPRPRLAYANACDSMSLLSSVNETPTRRIGFTPQESRPRQTALPTGMLSRTPHYTPNPNPTRPPLGSPSPSYQPRQPMQFSSLSYVQGAMQADSMPGHRT